ncbi:MAG TPA: hypothetical protein VL136_11230 [Candidatus Babeliales bacterium]|nr:hypothetical protein [Candidatus Babeliales bacterium]
MTRNVQTYGSASTAKAFEPEFAFSFESESNGVTLSWVRPLLQTLRANRL